MQDSLLARVGEAVWGWPMMALFLGTGIWYMLRLRGLPLRRLGQALRAIFRGGESADGISPYAALCTALAATIGTGNIVGVATAVLSLPLRYMHTPIEVISRRDLEDLARLLAAFVEGIGEEAESR